METKSKVNEIIGEEIEIELQTGRKQVSMFYTIKLLQHIKVILQKTPTICRSEISRQLIECINTLVRSHKQVMQYHERRELLNAEATCQWSVLPQLR
jgi:hypothetical protein